MQDIRSAVRPVFFQNDYEEWLYSTHGGTLFVVNFCGRPYGLTCKHVFKDFDEGKLFVSRDVIPKKGTSPATVKGFFFVPGEDENSDIAVVLFEDKISPDFFQGTAYVINEKTAGTSDTAHKLRVHGYLKDKTTIDYETKSIVGGMGDLGFHEVGPTSKDPYIRSAMATYQGHQFHSLMGLSGAPVFDETMNRLCGMVVRGGLQNNGAAIMWYIDILHILKLLEAISKGESKVSYTIYRKAN